MSTRGVIAVSHDGETWQGRYHHWDSYPEGLGMALQLCYVHFRGDLRKMLDYLIEQHPAGWSTIVRSDFHLEPGFVADFRRWHLESRPQCFCHGDRSEPELLISCTDDTDTEWAYVFDLKNAKFVIYHKLPWGNRWVRGASFPLSALPLTEEQLMQAGDACEEALAAAAATEGWQ
jgi:hypothetical protein